MFVQIDIYNLNINEIKWLIFNKAIILLALLGYELLVETQQVSIAFRTLWLVKKVSIHS